MNYRRIYWSANECKKWKKTRFCISSKPNNVRVQKKYKSKSACLRGQKWMFISLLSSTCWICVTPSMSHISVDWQNISFRQFRRTFFGAQCTLVFRFCHSENIIFPDRKKNETEKITEFGFRSFTFASFYVPQKWHFSAAFRRIAEENKGKMKSQNMQFVVRRYRQCKQKTTESTTSAPTNEFDAFQVRARDDACCKNHIMFIAMNSVASGSRFVCTKNH